MSYHTEAMPRQIELLELSRKLIQPLLSNFHKGQAGRITIIGGSEDYTGAPFFAAHSALLVGADLTHVICEKAAGPIIKGYTPDLMVHPYLYDTASIEKFGQIESKISLFESNPKLDNVINLKILPKISTLLGRTDVVIVGPGFGRDPVMLRTLVRIIEEIKVLNKPVIFDADALYLVSLNPTLIKSYAAKVLLTPNVAEFKRIAEALGVQLDPSTNSEELVEQTKRVSQVLNGVTIIRKGKDDIIVKGDQVAVCQLKGSNKRVGGQGDTLTGAVATLLNWSQNFEKNLWETNKDLCNIDRVVLATFAACALVRVASAKGFEKYGRSLQTSNVHEFVHEAYEELFGPEEEFKKFLARL